MRILDSFVIMFLIAGTLICRFLILSPYMFFITVIRPGTYMVMKNNPTGQLMIEHHTHLMRQDPADIVCNTVRFILFYQRKHFVLFILICYTLF